MQSCRVCVIRDCHRSVRENRCLLTDLPCGDISLHVMEDRSSITWNTKFWRLSWPSYITPKTCANSLTKYRAYKFLESKIQICKMTYFHHEIQWFPLKYSISFMSWKNHLLLLAQKLMKLFRNSFYICILSSTWP